MRSVILIAMKDLKLLFRDRMGLFFIIGFPILMGVFFGFINGAVVSQGSAKIRVGVVDEDQSEMSAHFQKSLGDIAGLQVDTTDRESAIEQVRKGRLVGFVVLTKGFGETAGLMWMDAPEIEIGTDPSRAAESGMLQGYVMQAMGTLIQKRFSDPAEMRSQLAKISESIDRASEMPIGKRLLLKSFFSTLDQFLNSVGDLNTNSDSIPLRELEFVKVKSVDVTAARSERDQLLKKIRSPFDISFPSATLWGIMGCVAGFAISLVRERSAGTFLRLSIAPIHRAHILAGKGLACFLSSVCVVVIMTALGKCLGIQLARPDLLVLAILCIGICFTGLMMLMSVIGKTEEAVGGAGWAIITLMCMFGGGMVPLAFLPGFMQTLSNFSPVKWGILVLEGAIWRDFTLGEMLPPCGILIAIGVTAFGIGVTILSRRE